MRQLYGRLTRGHLEFEEGCKVRENVDVDVVKLLAELDGLGASLRRL